VSEKDGIPLELINKIKGLLKLNQYEARVLLALCLEGGPRTVREISKRSDVPVQRVYDVLESLKSKGLVVRT